MPPAAAGRVRRHPQQWPPARPRTQAVSAPFGHCGRGERSGIRTASPRDRGAPTGGSPPLKHPDNSPYLYAHAMWWLVGGAGTMALLPNYFSSLGLADSEVALLMAVPALTAIGMAQAWGYLADMHFRRSSLLAFQAFMCLLCASLFVYIPGNLWLLAAGYFLLSAFSGARVSMLNSIVFASPRAEGLYGPIRLSGTVGYTAVLVAMGLLFHFREAPIGTIWLALAGCEALSVLVALRMKDVPPSERTAGAAPRIGFGGAQKRLLGNPVIAAFLVFTLCTQIGHWPPQMLMSRFLESEVGASRLMQSVAIAAASTSEMVVFLYGQQIMRRFSLVNMMGFAAALIAVRNLLVWIWPTLPVAIMSNTLHLFTFGIAYLVGVTFMNRVSPPELRSSAQTLFGITFFSFPILFGNLLASFLLRFITLHEFYLVGACISGLGMLAFPRFARAAKAAGAA